MKNQPVKKGHKRIDYKVISFVLFTVAFFGIFAIRPSISLIYSLQKEKADYEKIDQTLEAKIQQIIATQNQYMELVNNKSVVDQALPGNHEIEKTKAFLKLNPELSQFSIQKIKILPKDTPGLNKVVFSLSGSASYQDLTAYLDYIDQSRRLMTVQLITVEKGGRASDSASLNFNSVLNTYYYQQI